MIKKALNWIFLLASAALFYAATRYCLLSDFQGYLTVPVAGREYGFGHVKSATVLVPGRFSPMIPLPSPVIWLCYLAIVAAFIIAVRRILRRPARGQHHA